jgi:tetratricopeptide (TPR) repeat protein
MRGDVRKNLKNYTGAMSDYDKAIALDAQNMQAYLNRGLLKVQMNNSAAACADFNVAAKAGLKDAIDAAAKYCK